MKITLEFDPMNPGTVTTSAPTATPEPMPEPAAEVRAEAAMPAAKPEPTPKPRAAAAIPKEEPQPAGGGDFRNMGAVKNISDPDANNPNVFQFQMPREG